jgi:hypothetical protein
MSRTDKTQPFHISLWDGTLDRVAIHDHTDGVCDLPATYREDIAQYVGVAGHRTTTCYWSLHYTGTNVCCCSLCHDSAGLRAKRRADRHRARRELTDLVKVARTDWRSLD